MASINGTSGNDTLDGSPGSVNDILSGGLGNDLYRYNVGSGSDVIVDTGGADILVLGDPNNLNPLWDMSRSGIGGKDLLVDLHGLGSVTVTNQFLSASAVETLAFAGGWGSFSIASGVTGTAGDDVLVGTSAAETLTGNAGDDLIFAGTGNDRILGGDGDDEIHDGLGNDSIVGGAGDEWIEVDGGSNVIDGGTGWDDVSYVRATLGVTVNLSGQAQDGLADGHVLKSVGVEDTLAGIERIDGSAYADVFYGGRTTGEGGYNAGQVDFSGGGGNDTYHVGSGVNGDGAWASVDYGDDKAGVIVNLSNASVTFNGFLVASKSARDGGGDTDTFVLSGDKLGINGSDFADYLRGQSVLNNGWLSGGAGNDTIVGGSSSRDQAGYDGWGDRAIYGAIVNLSASSITVSGVTGDTTSVTVASNRARDSFGDTDTLQSIESASGSSFNDYIVGGSSGGWFGGQDGNDTLIGGAGEDNIEGGDGNDKLVGGASGDWLSGGAGNDNLDGGSGSDAMQGGDGSDTYYVRDTGDVVSETNANASVGGIDTVYSYLAAYTLGANVENGRISSAGIASLTGNALGNVLYAGAGNNGLDGGAGTDTASYLYSATAVTVSLAITGAQATIGSGSDTLIGIENLTGSNFNDTLTGNSGNNVLDGGAGNDSMAGGLGNDIYVVNAAGDVVSEVAGQGVDLIQTTVSYSLADTDGAGLNGGNVENLRLMGSGNLNATGNALANVIYANGGVNSIDGAGGVDTVSFQYLASTGTTGVTLNLSLLNAAGQATASGIGGADLIKNIENITGSNYKDTLTGNAGANVLDGGAGVDTMTGGDGNDTYYVRDSLDAVTETNASASTGGTDSVYSYLAAYTLGTNVENGRILATGAANLTGNALNNVLYAGVGNNVLNGGAGTDTASYLYASAAVTVSLAVAGSQATGGAGSDSLIGIENLAGSNFNDTLTGNGGINILTGGLGVDVLTGNGGNDLFDFNALAEMGVVTNSATWDVITDFNAGDRVDLSTLDANATTAANDAFSYSMGASFSAAGQLRYDSAAHVLYGNTDGNFLTAEFAIKLTGVAALASGDFVL